MSSLALMSRKLETTRLTGSTASRPKQRTCLCWLGRLGGSAGLAGLVGWMAGRVCGMAWLVGGHCGPGRLAWLAGSGGTAGRVCRLGRQSLGTQRARPAGQASLVCWHGWPGRAGRKGRIWPGQARWCCRSGSGGSGTGWAWSFQL